MTSCHSNEPALLWLFHVVFDHLWNSETCQECKCVFLKYCSLFADADCQSSVFVPVSYTRAGTYTTPAPPCWVWRIHASDIPASAAPRRRTPLPQASTTINANSAWSFIGLLMARSSHLSGWFGLFAPKFFMPVVATYKCLLLFCECTWGGGSTCRWWGHLTTICCNEILCAHGGGGGGPKT